MVPKSIIVPRAGWHTPTHTGYLVKPKCLAHTACVILCLSHPGRVTPCHSLPWQHYHCVSGSQKYLRFLICCHLQRIQKRPLMVCTMCPWKTREGTTGSAEEVQCVGAEHAVWGPHQALQLLILSPCSTLSLFFFTWN